MMEQRLVELVGMSGGTMIGLLNGPKEEGFQLGFWSEADANRAWLEATLLGLNAYRPDVQVFSSQPFIVNVEVRKEDGDGN